MSNQFSPPDPRMPSYRQSTANDETIQTYNAGEAAHAQSQRANYVDPTGNQVEQQQETVEDKNLDRANTRYWIRTITYFVLGVLEVILFLRFLFRLLGANQSNDFIMFLYSLSLVFVGAFNGIFNDQALGHSVFELSTIVAMLIYALIAWGIVSLGEIVFAPRMSGQQNVVTTRRNQPM
jgi:cation transport ATPase